MKAETYICAHCKGEFAETPDGDERARDEAMELWGCDINDPDMVVVCDDCFKDFMDWYEATEQE